MIPDRETCLRVLDLEEMPDHIRTHSVLVAEVALKVGKALNSHGQNLDMDLLLAGALLHDIRKMYTINHGGNHALLGGERVVALGFPELAPLVSRHVDLGLWYPEGPATEVEVVNYSDKRVKHHEVVSLVDRFDDLLSRYGKTDSALGKINEHRLVLYAVEKKFIALLGGDSSPLEFLAV